MQTTFESSWFSVYIGDNGRMVANLDNMTDADNDTALSLAAEALKSQGVSACYSEKLGDARHVFTHRIWNMNIYHYIVAEQPEIRSCRWVDADELAALPLPTAMKKARQAARSLLRQE